MIGVLLLAQWLVAAYACPVVTQALSSSVQSVAGPAAMPNCRGGMPENMDPTDPAMCKAHCDADQQLPAYGTVDNAPVLMLVWFSFSAFELPAVAGQPVQREPAPLSGAPPGWPPLYLTHLVLRN